MKITFWAFVLAFIVENFSATPNDTLVPSFCYDIINLKKLSSNDSTLCLNTFKKFRKDLIDSIAEFKKDNSLQIEVTKVKAYPWIKKCWLRFPDSTLEKLLERSVDTLNSFEKQMYYYQYYTKSLKCIISRFDFIHTLSKVYHQKTKPITFPEYQDIKDSGFDIENMSSKEAWYYFYQIAYYHNIFPKYFKNIKNDTLFKVKAMLYDSTSGEQWLQKFLSLYTSFSPDQKKIFWEMNVDGDLLHPRLGEFYIGQIDMMTMVIRGERKPPMLVKKILGFRNRYRKELEEFFQDYRKMKGYKDGLYTTLDAILNYEKYFEKDKKHDR